MKKLSTFLLLLITSGLLVAQNFNQFDTNGKRHGKWKKNFDKTDVIRYEGEFNHGKEIGTFKFYKNIAGKPLLTATKVFNTNNDITQVTFFTSIGKKISEGKMNGRTYIGKWLYYHKNSTQLMTEEFYNTKGELEGERKVYYLSGQVAEIAHYKAGLLYGESKWYSESGTIIKTITYKDDLFNGSFKAYDNKGVLVKEGYYKNDVKCCVWKRYKDGELVEEKDLSKRGSNTKKED